jgi:hypothetical protein
VTTATVTKKTGRNNYEQFQACWRHSPKKFRGVKYLLQPTPEQTEMLEELQSKFKVLISTIAKSSLVKFKSGEYDQKHLKKKRDNLPDVLRKEYAQLLHDTIGQKRSSMERSVTEKVLQILKSYKKRNNKTPKSSPRVRNERSTYFKCGTHRDLTPLEREGDILLKVLNGNAIKVQYVVPKGMFQKKLAMVKREERPDGEVRVKPLSPGGNLVNIKGRWLYACVAKVPFGWAYQPVCAIGIDLNQLAEYLMTLSTGRRITATPAITKVVERLKKLNAELKDKGLVKSSRQRRAVRRKVQMAHRELHGLCEPLCEDLLREVVDKKALLCIDDLTCGARTGSFGHDKIRLLLAKECEDRGIPFVMMPTHHTSRVHHECQKVADDTPQTYRFCPHCNAEYVSHENAAKNIAEWGMKIWTEGMDTFIKWRRQYAKNKKGDDSIQPSGPACARSRVGGPEVGVSW